MLIAEFDDTAALERKFVADGTELLVRDVRFPAAKEGEPDMARTDQFGRN
jgi:hypothetical protein